MSSSVMQAIVKLFNKHQQRDKTHLAAPYSFDWSLVATPYVVDLTTQNMLSKLDGVQSVFIDNSGNNGLVTITTAAPLTQTISIPAGSQGCFPFLVPDQLVFTVATVGNGKTNVVLVNFELPFGVWSAATAPVVIANPLPVSDAALEAIITGGKLATVTTPVANADADHSGTVAVGGTAVTAAAANPNRRGRLLQNIDEVNLEDIWWSTTGTAAANTVGSFSLAASGGVGSPGGAAQGSGTGAISVVAATAGHKFSLITW